MTAEEIIEELPRLTAEEIETVSKAIQSLIATRPMSTKAEKIRALAKENGSLLREAWGNDPAAEIRRLRDQE
jgi:hypothetical protein